MGNTSATTCAGKVVGDRITEFNEFVLYGLKLELIAASGSSLFSSGSKVEDLKGLATSKTRYGKF